MISIFRKLNRRINNIKYKDDHLKILCGKALSRMLANNDSLTVTDAEFSVFSQNGEDGIIQYILNKLELPAEFRTFVEFGVQDYYESNTRFLLQGYNWKGLIIDGSRKNIRRIVDSPYFWKHGLQVSHTWLHCDNINQTISASGLSGTIGILSIDLDGIDYWIWDAIHVIKPIIVIIEWNSRFGPEAALTVPYDIHFNRYQYCKSGTIWGASITALNDLASSLGYSLICSNTSGNNLFFVCNKWLSGLQTLSPSEAYVQSIFKEDLANAACGDAHVRANSSNSKKNACKNGDVMVYDLKLQSLHPFSSYQQN